jgi:two-component system, cell cycle sensor histidine kinase and response regulator CckA
VSRGDHHLPDPGPIHVLIVDDDPEDAELVQVLLREAGEPVPASTWARTFAEGIETLVGGGFDVCLVDYRLGAETGIDFLESPRVVGTDVPVIVMTGRDTREVDSMALAAGAVDYLPKEALTASALARALRYAVERRRRQRSESLARALLGSVREILSLVDPDTMEIRFVSASIERVLGYRPEDRIGATTFLETHPDDRSAFNAAVRQVAEQPGHRVEVRHRVRHADGTWRTLETIAENHAHDPYVAGIVASSRDISERVQREDEVRFQARLLEAVGQAVIVTDMEGTVAHWNPAAERLYGWTREEAVGQPIASLTVPDVSRERAEAILEEIRTAGSWSGEFQASRSDGSTFPALVSNSLIHDAAGRAVGLIGVSSDLTHLKETEAALRERVKELRTLTYAGEILNRNDMTLEARLEGVVAQIPQGWRHPEHTEARLALGELEARTPGFRSTPFMQRVEVVTREQTGVLEVAYTGPAPGTGDGPFLAEEESVLQNLARLIADTVDREALQRVLTRVFASMEEAVLVIDPSHGARGISYLNPAAERIFGYRADELVGGTTEPLHVDREAFQRFGRESRDALESHGVFHGAYAMRRKDRSTFEAEQTVTLLDPERGHAGGAVSVVRDVSERTMLEQQLRQMQKMESVGQLAGGIAHDFNNVLTVIRSQVDLVLMDLGDASPAAEDLRLVQTAADRAATLTAQLLAFSREQVLLPRTVDLGTVVNEAGRLLERLIGEQIRLVYDLDAELPPVRIDPNRMEQVLMNLAVNARDAMPDGGTLTLSTRLETLGPSETEALPWLEPGRWVVLVVEDTGTGMTEEVRRKAFDPFFSTKPRGKGTGLGLAMVYGTVKQSGGSIQVESEPGQGTRFLLRFPPAEPTPDGSVGLPEDGSSSHAQRRSVDGPASRTEPATAPPPEGECRVLVVDDDPAVRRAVVKVLERSGFDCLEADEGNRALEILRGAPDVAAVLSDLVLPGLSGFELLARLRAERPELPLIAMSGYAEGAPNRLQALPPGVDFIEKPFASEDLVAAMQGACRRGQAGRGSLPTE